ncbi:MAG: hypothetical protein RL681_336 [Candidatus Parcubacteria bacterium]|jgi:predicted ribosomally synthesized peptide with SipW-like signal peptide
MKKILLSASLIVAVGAAVIGATSAFFNDTETSTGNTFTAGALDLKIDNTSYGFDWNNPLAEKPTGAWGLNPLNTWQLSDLTNQLFFNFVDLKPGDYGEDTISAHVDNDAWACVKLTLTDTPENNRNEAELEAGDVTSGASEGELQSYLNFAFWKDDGDNVYEEGEGPILFNGPANTLSGQWEAIADAAHGPALPANGPETASYIGKFWCFGTISENAVNRELSDNTAPTEDTTGFNCVDLDPQDNVAQTDGVKMDVAFYSVQARHNDQFLCSSLNQPTEPETATVTLDKVVTFTQASVQGVDVNDFTLHLVGPGGDHILVDEVAMPGLTPGAYTVSEVYSNDPAGIQFNGSFSGGCAEIGDTGTATMNVVAGVNPTCVITNLVTTPIE